MRPIIVCIFIMELERSPTQITITMNKKCAANKSCKMMFFVDPENERIRKQQKRATMNIFNIKWCCRRDLLPFGRSSYWIHLLFIFIMYKLQSCEQSQLTREPSNSFFALLSKITSLWNALVGTVPIHHSVYWCIIQRRKNSNSNLRSFHSFWIYYSLKCFWQTAN